MKKIGYARPYFAILLTALCVYIFTCAPGPLWQDSGMLQYRVYHDDLAGRLGLALAHPLYFIVGIAFKHLPFGSLGLKVNLVSAVFGAITIANVFLLTRLWLDAFLPAAFAAFTLMLSHTFWQSSVIAEVYTLYTATFTAELIFLLCFIRYKKNKFLLLLFFFNGLSLANHMWAVIPLSVYAVYVIFLLAKRKLKPLFIIPAALLWLAGASPYIWLIADELIRTGNLVITISSALFGNSWQGSVTNTQITPRTAIENFLYLGMNFPTPNALFIVPALLWFRRLPHKTFTIIAAVTALLFFLFAFRYNVPDRYAFFLPFYFFFVIFLAGGFTLSLEKYQSKALVYLAMIFLILPVGIYTLLPSAAKKAGLKLGTKRTIPFRDDYTYFLQPWHGRDNSAHDFARAALTRLPEGAALWADGTTVYPLWYVQEINGIRKDVLVISTHGSYNSPANLKNPEQARNLIEKQGLYAVSPVPGYCPEFLITGFDFAEEGVLHKVTEKK